MLTSNTISNDVALIVDALMKKSKIDFRRMKSSLILQAEYFAPAYREFIYKVIKNGSLKIKYKFHDGYITPLLDKPNNESRGLKARSKNIIYADICNRETLPHELGHSVDFMFGFNNQLSCSVVIKDNKTLFDIFTEEFETKKEELYQMVMDEYKTIINQRVNPNAFDIIMDNMEDFCELSAMNYLIKDPSARKTRRRFQKKLYDSGFVDAYADMYLKKCYAPINYKYSPILDALSSSYNFDGLLLDSHEFVYYTYKNTSAVEEFFANVFAAKVTGNHIHFGNIIKLLPKSFDAFERLFVIIYDHIQNNKRFTDLKLK